MSHSNDSKKRPNRVAEPVQVYLAPDDQQRLARLTSQLDASKSDILRRGLEALERQYADPALHPALSMLGLADTSRAQSVDYDIVREHDRFLTESEEASWKAPLQAKRGK